MQTPTRPAESPTDLAPRGPTLGIPKHEPLPADLVALNERDERAWSDLRRRIELAGPILPRRVSP